MSITSRDLARHLLNHSLSSLSKTAFAPMPPAPPPALPPQTSPKELMQIMSRPDVQQALGQQGIQITQQGPMANGQMIDPATMAQILQSMGLLAGVPVEGQAGMSPPPQGAPMAPPPAAPAPAPMNPGVPAPGGTPVTMEALMEVMPAILAQSEELKNKSEGKLTMDDMSARMDDLEKMIFSMAQTLGLPPGTLGMTSQEVPATLPAAPAPEAEAFTAGLTNEALAAASAPPQAMPPEASMVNTGPGMPGPESVAPPGMPPQASGMNVMASERRSHPASRIRNLIRQLKA